jgi:hypothetical protein
MSERKRFYEKKEAVPIGSVPVVCPECSSKKGYDLYEAITDLGKPTERYYAVCLNCKHVISLKAKSRLKRLE